MAGLRRPLTWRSDGKSITKRWAFLESLECCGEPQGPSSGPAELIYDLRAINTADGIPQSPEAKNPEIM